MQHRQTPIIFHPLNPQHLARKQRRCPARHVQNLERIPRQHRLDGVVRIHRHERLRLRIFETCDLSVAFRIR